jgi:hypothetical protein
MKNQALENFIIELSKVWGPLDSQLTKNSKYLLEELTINCKNEDWINELLKNRSFQKPRTWLHTSSSC